MIVFLPPRLPQPLNLRAPQSVEECDIQIKMIDRRLKHLDEMIEGYRCLVPMLMAPLVAVIGAGIGFGLTEDGIVSACGGIAGFCGSFALIYKLLESEK